MTRKKKAAVAAVVALAGTTGTIIYLSLPPENPLRYALRWTSDDPWTAYFEVEHSTNLAHGFNWLTNVPNSGEHWHEMFFLTDKPQEFFRVRAVGHTGLKSPWA